MPNPPIYNEPGFNGQVISLASVAGASGKGRQAVSNSFTLSGIVIIAPANPKRISAIIQNVGDPAFPGSQLGVYIGGVNTIPITLTENGTLQIDGNYPWTGEIYANAITNNPVVVVVEVTTT